MKILRITNIKDFMNKLLLTDLFDQFLLSEATIQTSVTYAIDGHLNKDFFESEEPEAEPLASLTYAPFSMLRTKCFELIKGKKTPASFKFVFMLSPDNLAKTLEHSATPLTANEISGAAINIRFSNGDLTCTSGIAYRTFTMDHSFEHAWDGMVAKFLQTHDVAFEEA